MRAGTGNLASPDHRGEIVGTLPVEGLAPVFGTGRLAEIEAAELHADELGPGPLGSLFKRVLDLVVVALVLVPTVLISAVIAVAVKLSSPGPVLFWQMRVGFRGRGFRVLKFRTMVQGAEARQAELRHLNESDGLFKIRADPRVTGVGRFLRRTYLDELPQLVNVLRRELSIVGPRPEQPRYVEELSKKLPYYDLRHLVRPGITGWAQVKYGYASSELDAFEKLQYEFYYLRHQGLALDLRILGRTLRAVVGRRGR